MESEYELDFCPECAKQFLRYEDRPDIYEVVCICGKCGYEDSVGYEDVYGPMSVPWGFLL